MQINSPSLISPSPSQASQKSSAQLSSGLRIQSAGDDAAGLQIAQGMSSQVRGLNQGLRNLTDSTSLVQSREAISGTLVDNLQRMRELSLAAGNGINSQQDRDALNKEFQALNQQNTDLLQNSQFNGQSLFNSQGGQVNLGNAGQNFNLAGSQLAEQLGQGVLQDLSLNDPEALNKLDQALDLANASRAQDGASLNGIDQASKTLASNSLNQQRSLSSIQDTDFAKTISQLRQSQTQEQAQILLQSQANANRGQVLRLLGG